MSENQFVYQQEYQERKNKIVKFLGDAITYFKSLEKDAGKSQAEALCILQDDINNGLFSIVVVGEFSAGKSMFLNALMKKRLLPSWKLETTATVNFLRHASAAPNQEKGIIYYENDEKQTLNSLDKDLIQSLVTTKGKQEDAERGAITRVDFFLDNKFLDNGVMLVDSPGINGLTPKLEEITDQQIKESHASIFMFSAEKPGSKTDFEELKKLKKFCPRIFIVLNKIDLIKEEENETPESIVAQLRKHYQQQFPKEKLPEIFPISAEQALDARDPQSGIPEEERKELEKASRMEAFEDRLWKYLTQGKRSRDNFEMPLIKSYQFLNDEQEQLKELLKHLQEKPDVEEINKQKEILAEKIANLKKQKIETVRPLKTEFRHKLRDIKDRITASRDTIENNLSEEMKNSGFSAEELKDYGEQLPNRLELDMNRLLRNLDDDLQEELRDIVEEQTNQYFVDLDSQMQEQGVETVNFKADDLKLDNIEVGYRLEEDTKAIDALAKELEQLEEEEDVKRRDKYTAMRAENEIASKREELKLLRQRQSDLMTTFYIPEVRRYQVEQPTTRSRTGLFGEIAEFLVGEKEVMQPVEKVDSTEHDAAIAERTTMLNQIGDEIREIQTTIQDKRISSDAIALDIERVQKRITRQRKELNKKREEFHAHLDEEDKKAARRYMTALRSYVAKQLNEVEKTAKNFLDLREKSFLNAVQGMIEIGINDELVRQQKRLDELVEAEKTSDKERAAKIENTQNRLEAVKKLIEEEETLQVEVENDMNDEIKEA